MTLEEAKEILRSEAAFVMEHEENLLMRMSGKVRLAEAIRIVLKRMDQS